MLAFGNTRLGAIGEDAVREGLNVSPRWLAAIFFGTLTLLSVSAQAGTIRVPEVGDPAFTLDCPDDWTHDPPNGQSIVVTSGDRSTSIVLLIGPNTLPLDNMVAVLMKGLGASPPTNTGSTDISGYHGFAYESAMTSSAGLHVNMRIVAVKLDNSHAAVIAMQTLDSISTEQFAVGSSVFRGATLSRTNP